MKPMTMVEGFERSGAAGFAGASMCCACDSVGRNPQDRAARTAVRIRKLQRCGEFQSTFVRLAIPRATSLALNCTYRGRNSMMFLRFCNGYFRHITHGSGVPGTYIRGWLRRAAGGPKAETRPGSGDASRPAEFPSFSATSLSGRDRLAVAGRYSSPTQKRAQFAEKRAGFAGRRCGYRPRFETSDAGGWFCVRI